MTSFLHHLDGGGFFSGSRPFWNGNRNIALLIRMGPSYHRVKVGVSWSTQRASIIYTEGRGQLTHCEQQEAGSDPLLTPMPN